MLWNVIAILLLLLKILGILLLVLLGVILLILFLPLRYQVLLTQHEDERMMRGRVSWLGFFVRLAFYLGEGGMIWKLRVFGIPVLSGGAGGTSDGKTDTRKRKQSKKQNKKQKAAKNIEKTEQSVSINETGKIQQIKAETERDAEVPETVDAGTDSEASETADEGTGSKASETADAGTDAKSSGMPVQKRRKKFWFVEKIQQFWRKIRKFFETAGKLFRLLRQKIHSLQGLSDLLRDERAKRTICIVKDNVIHLWKQVRPRKIRGDIIFGTGDPCTTGQILGGISVLYGWIGQGVKITPDFEERRLEGKLNVFGRIRVITLIVFVIRLMFQKDCRQLWKELEQWKEDF